MIATQNDQGDWVCEHGTAVDCARWLKQCLDLGWRKSDLDVLEALWWKYHDDQGTIAMTETRAEQR
jgi:hypothetical protein